MKRRPRSPEQDDLLRPRLIDVIDPRHALVKLAGLIDWEVFEREWAGFFPSGKGRPATEPRLVARLVYLQHAYRLSDEAVVARWVETPYDQHVTGETFFQHKLPIDPSSLTRWRGREGVEWLLTQTIRAGQTSGVIDEKSARRVAGVDRDYRGHDEEKTRVLISGTRRGLTAKEIIDLRRRSAIEAENGHMKTDGHLSRCHLKGTIGDAIFAIPNACSHNIRKILAHLRAWLAWIITVPSNPEILPNRRYLTADAE